MFNEDFYLPLYLPLWHALIMYDVLTDLLPVPPVPRDEHPGVLHVGDHLQHLALHDQPPDHQLCRIFFIFNSFIFIGRAPRFGHHTC
jgi:hypothetical protein